MLFRVLHSFRTTTVVILLLLAGVSKVLAASCDCADGVQIPLVMRQYGYFAGVFRNQVTVDGAAVDALEYRAGRVEPNPARPGEYRATAYGCSEWDRSVRVLAAPRKIIAITTSWETDPTDPDYTEAGDPPAGWVGMNPTTVINWPSESCVKLFISFDGGANYAPFEHGQAYAPGAVDTPYTVLMYFEYGEVAHEEEGASEGPMAGVEPLVAPNFVVNDIASRCGGSAAALLSSDGARMEADGATSKGKREFRPRLERESRRGPENRKLPDAYRARAQRPVPGALVRQGRLAAATAGVSVRNEDASNLYSPIQAEARSTPFAAAQADAGGLRRLVTEELEKIQESALSLSTNVVPGARLQSRIGGVRMRIGLGHDAGALVYEVPTIGANAYRPATLRLSGSIRPLEWHRRDGTGALRQLLSATAAIDIVTVSASRFEVRYYRYSQVEPSPEGFLIVDDHPFCTWVIENPDEHATNRIRFVQHRGGEQATHLVTWSPASGAHQGQMQVSYFDDQIIEDRTYFREQSGAPFRGERIQRRRGADGIVEHDVYEAYMEFYNWGEPGEVHEAMVYRVEGVETAQPRVTEWTYADDGFLKGRFVTSVIHPDGYWERYIYAADGELRSTFSPWVDAPAHPALVNATFTNCQHDLVWYQEGNDPATQEWRIVERWVPNGSNPDQPILISRSETLRDYGASGGYREDTWTWIDGSDYVQSTQIRERRGGALLFDAREDNSTTRFVREWGFWIPESEAFAYTGGWGAQVAQRVVQYEGNRQNTFGVAEQTLITVRVEDVRGRPLLEEVYVHDGAPFAPGLREDSISREVYTYDDSGHLLSVTRNGSVVRERVYDELGRLREDIDETGVREVMSYDAFGRVQSRIRHEGALTPPKTFTYTYDAAHHVLTETLTASDSATSIQRTTTYRYDTAGRLIAHITPDGLTHGFSELFLGDGAGHILRRQVTQTRPDLSEIVSEYHQDRRLFRRYGAVPTEYIGYGHATFLTDLGSGPMIAGYPVSVSYSDYGISHRKTAWSNWVGQTIQEVRPGFAPQTSYLNLWYYDGAKGGQLGMTYHGVNTGSGIGIVGQAPQVFEYDAFGRLARQGLDYNFNWVLDANGADPMTLTTRSYERSGSPAAWYRVVRHYQLQTEGAGTQTLIEEERQQLTGLAANVSSSVETWSGGQRSTTQVEVERATATETVTRRNHAWDAGVPVDVQVRIGGRLASSRAASADGATTYTYNPDGSIASVADPKLGSVRYLYASNGRLATVVDALDRSTQFAYHPQGGPGAGMLAHTADPAGAMTRYAYDSRSRLWRQWGSATYPQEWTYDNDDRLVGLKTFRTVDGGSDESVDWTAEQWPANAPAGDITRWVYHASGLLERKIYADNTATVYSYDNIGRLRTRTNARFQVATYSYENNRSGLLSGITYSAGSATPAVGILYDRALRRRQVSDGSGTRVLTYTDLGALAGEHYTSGLLAGYGTERTYTSQHQLEDLQVPGVYTARWSYDAQARPSHVSGIEGTIAGLEVEYVREPGADWLKHTIWRSDGAERLRSSREFDEVGRLREITTRNGVNELLQRFHYAAFDQRDRRTRVEREDGSYWEYGYNTRGELETARRGGGTGPAALPQEFDYRYDSIGNRRTATTNGRTEQYEANALNQYLHRTVPGVIPVSGSVAEDAHVTADYFPAERNGETFRVDLPVDNSAGPVWKAFDVTAVRNEAGPAGEDVIATTSRSAFVARTPEGFSYDADGNMVADGRWMYAWDAENRLISCETTASAAGAGVPVQRLEFLYDSSGRRVSKRVLGWAPGTASWVPQSEIRFLYDDWNLVAELTPSATGLNLLRTHWWGLDIAGISQNPNSLGGLLTTVNASSRSFVSTDALGNICLELDEGTGVFRSFKYNPFGAKLGADGASIFGFSCQYFDSESGSIYYGHRYYSPDRGRWLSRDPLAEHGGLNVYGFVGNDPSNQIDVRGLISFQELLDFVGRLNDVRLRCRNNAAVLEQLDQMYSIVSDRLGVDDHVSYALDRAQGLLSELQNVTVRPTSWNNPVPSFKSFIDIILLTAEFTSHDYPKELGVDPAAYAAARRMFGKAMKSVSAVSAQVNKRIDLAQTVHRGDALEISLALIGASPSILQNATPQLMSEVFGTTIASTQLKFLHGYATAYKTVRGSVQWLVISSNEYREKLDFIGGLCECGDDAEALDGAMQFRKTVQRAFKTYSLW